MASQIDTSPDPSTNLSALNVQRDRAKEADPNKGRCLLENQTESIQACHCIPRKFMAYDDVLDSLEWFWNLKRCSLNLDSQHNIIFLGSRLHFLLENFVWLLLPEETIIKQYHDSLSHHAQRELFPKIPNGVFVYRFVPLRVVSMPIVRQTVVPPDGILPSSGDFTIYTYPFDRFPSVRSHLHPKFAIFEAGRRLEGLEPTVFKKLLVDFPSLTLIGHLYEAWLRAPPAAWMTDISYSVPSVKDVDNSDQDGDDDNDDPDGDLDSDDQTSIGRPFGIKYPAQSSPTKRKGLNPRPSGKRKVFSEVKMGNRNRRSRKSAGWIRIRF